MLNNYENEVICWLTSPWRPQALLPESGDDSHLITSRAPARSISEHLGIWTFGQTTLIRNSRAPPRLTAALLSPRLGSWPAAGDGGGGNAACSVGIPIIPPRITIINYTCPQHTWDPSLSLSFSGHQVCTHAPRAQELWMLGQSESALTRVCGKRGLWLVVQN